MPKPLQKEASVYGGGSNSEIVQARRSRPDSPLIPDVGVIALVPDQWHWQWQPRHQIMTRLAAYFPVLWLIPPEDWRHSLFQQKLRTTRDETPIPGVDFLVHHGSPFLPHFHTSWAAGFTFRKRLRKARRILSKKGCKKIVLYLWRPEFRDALDYVSADFSCYHIDDEYSFSPVDTPISAQEKELIERVDHVFIHSPALLEKKGQINPHTSFAPNGVDFDDYAQPRAEPDDLRDLPHPRIGYSGRIKRQLDWRLLLELTARHPEWSFVLVGACNPHPEIQASLRELSGRKNVRFLGEKTTHELAAYPQHFDVAIMPYVNDDYTKYIYPLKLHEYLAGGSPVVGTPIPSLEPFRDSLLLPENSEQWSAAITRSLEPGANSAEARASRQSLAKSHDWNLIVAKIARTIARGLGPAYSDRFDQNTPSDRLHPYGDSAAILSVGGSKTG
jgi:glycosyltransferase involved in cell wall biosynthesis